MLIYKIQRYFEHNHKPFNDRSYIIYVKSILKKTYNKFFKEKEKRMKARLEKKFEKEREKATSESRAEGRVEGEKLGIAKALLESAKRMIKKGIYSLEEIVENLNLPLSKGQTISAQMV